MDAAGAALRLLGEKARQPLRRNVGVDAGGIDAGAGLFDGMAVDVGGEHLHPETLLQRLQMLLKQDGDGIGLLAGGTARHPDPYQCARGLAVKEAWDDLFLERLERLRVAEEMGDADQEVAKEGLRFGRVLLQVAYVPVQPLDLVDGHAPLDAAAYGVFLVLGKVVTRLGAQQDEDLFQRVFGLGGRRRERARRSSERVGDVGHEPPRHLGRRQYIVHQAGVDGTVRHAVVLGGLGVLRHRHAAFALDRPQAQGPVAAGPREHDADGPLVLVLGQRAEEKVNRQAQAAGRGLFQQLQCAVQKGHVAVGRDDVRAVGLHRHPIFDLEDLHPGIALDQLGEDALVVRGQVLHQDKGHAGISVGRHGGEEGFERRQSPGRCPDADDGKAPLGRPHCGSLTRLLRRPRLLFGVGFLLAHLSTSFR